MQRAHFLLHHSSLEKSHDRVLRVQHHLEIPEDFLSSQTLIDIVLCVRESDIFCEHQYTASKEYHMVNARSILNHLYYRVFQSVEQVFHSLSSFFIFSTRSLTTSISISLCNPAYA